MVHNAFMLEEWMHHFDFSGTRGMVSSVATSIGTPV
jgi:hypothetical protein